MAKESFEKCLEGLPVDKVCEVYSHVAWTCKEYESARAFKDMKIIVQIASDLDAICGAGPDLYFLLTHPEEGIPEGLIEDTRRKIEMFWSNK